METQVKEISVEDIEIKNSQNKTESIPDFLEKVSKLKLRVAN